MVSQFTLTHNNFVATFGGISAKKNPLSYRWRFHDNGIFGLSQLKQSDASGGTVVHDKNKNINRFINILTVNYIHLDKITTNFSSL